MHHSVDLAAEMAAARARREAQTAKAIRDARVLAVRTVARPGCTQVEIEEIARSFYPRLSDELLAEVTGIVWETHRGRAAAEAEQAAAARDAAAEPDAEVPETAAAES